jgi:hypothetical protein
MWLVSPAQYMQLTEEICAAVIVEISSTQQLCRELSASVLRGFEYTVGYIKLKTNSRNNYILLSFLN